MILLCNTSAREAVIVYNEYHNVYDILCLKNDLSPIVHDIVIPTACIAVCTPIYTAKLQQTILDISKYFV
jgi:hypothetical protein